MRSLISWETLQSLINANSEGADLDFKEHFDVAKPGNDIEAAKDVAALANVLGGHIVIGASTELGGTRCKGFHGIDRDAAAKVTKHIEEQVRDRCRPTPLVSVRIIDIPGAANVVAVVLVEASATAPIGIRVRQASGGKLTDEAWAFPYRVGSQTVYLQPDQFGAYESMSARRAAALLQSIPGDQREHCQLRWTVANPPGALTPFLPHHRDVAFAELNLRENVAQFRDRTDGGLVFGIPLDEITTVWRGSQAPWAWQVSMRGSLVNKDGGPKWDYIAGR